MTTLGTNLQTASGSDFSSFAQRAEERVNGLICIYSPCLYNRNARPTGPIDRINPDGSTHYATRKEIARQPEERLDVVLRLFAEARKEILTYVERFGNEWYGAHFNGNCPLAKLNAFEKDFRASCQEDLDMWDSEKW